jgi:hypothetical protein
MYIVTGTETDPATLYWASSDGINQAVLTGVPGSAGSPDASPSASPGTSPAASPSGTVSATPKPTKKP